MITGWYYLHENKELIYKSSPDAIADIRDSDLCKCAWAVDPSDRFGAWSILVESLAMDANKRRIEDLAEKWGCDDEDADIYGEKIGVSFYREGDKWMATRSDFQNIQDDPAGFGDSKLEAMAGLCKSLGFSGSTIGWHATFKDLVSK